MSATKEEIIAFIQSESPNSKYKIESVGDSKATLSLDVGTDELRPGGTVSGPVLMSIADIAIYIAILGEIGIVPLAVTTSLTINFLRRPSADRSIVAECSLIKVGRANRRRSVALLQRLWGYGRPRGGYLLYTA